MPISHITSSAWEQMNASKHTFYSNTNLGSSFSQVEKADTWGNTTCDNE